MPNKNGSISAVKQGGNVDITHQMRNGEQARDEWLNERGPLYRSARPINQILGFASHQIMVKINEFAGCKILMHESFAEKFVTAYS